MKTLRLELRFKNAVLFDALTDTCGRLATENKTLPNTPLGIIRAASEASGLSRGIISRLLNLQANPYYKGNLKKKAKALADLVGIDPTVLYPIELYGRVFPKLLVKNVEPEFLLEIDKPNRRRFSNLGSRPSAGKSRGGATTSREGAEEGKGIEHHQSEVTASRIHEIKNKALRRLRWPPRAKRLLEVYTKLGA